VDLDPVPVLVSAKPQIEGADGLLLMGGTDVNPKLYGAGRESETQDPDDERDHFELEILAKALQADLPVLAICRGLQLLNVYAGGTLRQHLASLRHDPKQDASFAHDVEIVPGTLLHSIARKERWGVNSYHHQAADRIGNELRVSARDAEDGIIEGLEHTGHSFVLGVQWHPEDLVFENPEQLRLFQEFAKRVVGS